jgi:hypothetical protein
LPTTHVCSYGFDFETLARSEGVGRSWGLLCVLYRMMEAGQGRTGRDFVHPSLWRLTIWLTLHYLLCVNPISRCELQFFELAMAAALIASRYYHSIVLPIRVVDHRAVLRRPGLYPRTGLVSGPSLPSPRNRRISTSRLHLLHLALFLERFMAARFGCCSDWAAQQGQSQYRACHYGQHYSKMRCVVP